MRPPTKFEPIAAELGHPQFDELVAFSLGRLSDRDSNFVETHLNQCDECCKKLLSLSPSDDFLAVLLNRLTISPGETNPNAH